MALLIKLFWLILFKYSFFWTQVFKPNAEGLENNVDCANYTLCFNGTHDFVLFNNLFPLHETDNRTIEFWFKSTHSNGSIPILWSSLDPDVHYPENRFSIGLTSNSLSGRRLFCDYIEPAHYTLFHPLGVGGLFANNVWVHHAIVRENNVYRIYTNGVLQSTVTDASPVLPTAIGWTISDNNNSFNGCIDELRFFDHAKSSQQILQSINVRFLGYEMGLIGLWNFDEGSGELAMDGSGYNNNGVLGGTGLDSWAYRPDYQVSTAPILYADTDQDNMNDCLDECPNNPEKTEAGTCGCYAMDADGDGYCNVEDCNDQNDLVHPEAIEYCDGLDNDCDGLIDEDFVLTVCQTCTVEGLMDYGWVTWYLDVDGDGHASATFDTCGHTPPGTGYVIHVLPVDDCNDNDPFDFVLGMPCDDGDDCTTGETIQPDCTCGGGTSLSNGNNALYLYGNGFLRISSQPAIDYKGNYTVEFWAKTEFNRSQDIIDNYHNSSGQWMEGFFVQSFAGIMRFCFTEDNVGTDVLKCFDISPPNDRQFHHFAWVKTAQSVSAYVDGNPEYVNPGYQTSGYNLLLPGNHSFSVGTANFNNPSFVGAIDELRIWRSALSVDQIQSYMDHSLAENCLGRDLGLYLDMNQSSGIEHGEVSYECGFPITPKNCNPCLAGDLDNDGICDSEDNCKTNNPGQEDEDCDGVGNACDQCPGGNDALDQDHNGLPDCAYPPAYSLMPASWKCAANKVAVCKVDKNNNTRQTICVNINAINAQVNPSNNNYCGPCNEAACLSAVRAPVSPWKENLDFQVFPNPAYRMVDLRIKGGHRSNSTLVLTDLLGRQIWKQKIEGYQQRIIRLDLHSLGVRPGIYLITAWAGEEILSKKLLVK